MGKWCPFCCCFLRCNFQNGHDIEFIERSRVDSLYDGFCFLRFAVNVRHRELLGGRIAEVFFGVYYIVSLTWPLCFLFLECICVKVSTQVSSKPVERNRKSPSRMIGWTEEAGRSVVVTLVFFFFFFVLRSVCRTNFWTHRGAVVWEGSVEVLVVVVVGYSGELVDLLTSIYKQKGFSNVKDC